MEDVRNPEEIIEMPGEGLTPEEEEEVEKERQREEEARLAPYKAAANQRKENASIIAEHDNLIADMLFEMTMNEMEG